MKTKEYKMNFATKTLTITKAFAEAALEPKSEASKVIARALHQLSHSQKAGRLQEAPIQKEQRDS